MTFLNPAILFGLFAASIPILIHLLNLRKLKRIEFSTLSFLKELQKKKIRKIKVKQWLLLALRVLLILLIVLAFARPTLETVSFAGLTSTAKTSAVILIDDSYSMGVVTPSGSNFNLAKQRAAELLSQLQDGDNAVIIPFSRADEDFSFSGDIPALREEVEQLELSQISSVLQSALSKAAGLMDESYDFNKEIYILSDFQQQRLTETGSPYGLADALQENTTIYIFDYSKEDVFNLGIAGLTLQTEIFERNRPLQFQAEVRNYSSRPVSNTVASLFINGKRSAQKSLDIGAGGTAVFTIEAAIDAGGVLDVLLELEDDDILNDNHFYSNLIVPERLNVLLLSENSSDLRFVEAALNAANSNGILNITQKNLRNLSSVNLSAFDVVLIAGSAAQKDVPAVDGYLQNGGGMLLMPAGNSTMPQFSAFLQRLGIPSPETRITINDNSNQQAVFNSVDYDHPLFNNLFLGGEKRQIESPSIFTYFRIFTQSGGKNIITLTDNSAFLSEYRKGSGRVLLFNTAPILESGDFPLKGIFAPLLYKTLFYLSARSRDQVSFTAGEDIPLELKNFPLGQITVIKPDDFKEVINFTGTSSSTIYRYKNTDRLGNYRFLSKDNIVDIYAVNTNPLESTVDYLTEEDLGAYFRSIGFDGNTVFVDADIDIQELLQQARYGAELWKLFLILALLVALVETALARSSKKDLASAGAGSSGTTKF